MIRSTLGSLLCTLLIASAASADVPSIPWQQTNFSYFAQDQEVADVLRNFGAMQGVRVVVSPQVKGEINGRFEKLPPEEFLTKMAKANALTWLWDGSVLHISRADENQTRIVQIEPAVFERFSTVMNKVGLRASEYDIRRLDDQGSTMLVGPPRFFQIVDGILGGIDLPASEMRVRVFQLQNAWANDLTFDYRDTKVIVPGVAAAVQRIMGNPAGPFTGGPVSIAAPARQEGLRGQGLASVGDPGQPVFAGPVAPMPQGAPPMGMIPIGPNGPIGPIGPMGVPPGANIPTGSVHADVRLNAVIVRDTADRMPIYQELIRQLDIPVAIIEINAAIIDLNCDFAFELGTEFAVAGSNGKDLFNGTVGGSLPTTTDSGLLSSSVQQLIGSGGFTGSALVVRSGVELLGRVHAMESKGNARILSRPSIMTLDNTEAIIRNDQTFYVRVAGDNATDLYNVTAGVLLKVTPHVVTQNGRPEIKMVINIEDGAVSTQNSVDNIPVVNKSSISTQAVVLESQSLLIGGLYHEQKTDVQSGVPVIQHVPVFGNLFKKKSKETAKMERMFLITPRIINLAYNGTPSVEGLFDTPRADERLLPVLPKVPVTVPATPPQSVKQKKTRASSK